MDGAFADIRQSLLKNYYCETGKTEFWNFFEIFENSSQL